MKTTIATAPGKIILFGEHAVVYGRPAIAIPISQVRARAVVSDSDDGVSYLLLPDLGEQILLTDESTHPLASAVQLVQQQLGLSLLPSVHVTINSGIPIASGLGSGAAIAAALIRALLEHFQEHVSTQRVCDLTYEVEKQYHGTPSGIDNTVVSYEQPVYFRRQQPHNLILPLQVAQPLHFLVGDTGIRSSTMVVVGDVRQRWQHEPSRFEALFDRCGTLARQARLALERGEARQLGALMADNHDVLREMTVSSAELDVLVGAATAAGAYGAKLSGAGRGGNMIALVAENDAMAVGEALRQAGAHNVLHTTLLPTM